MNSFLDWLDEAAGGLIRFAYLAAGIVAVAVYFGAGTLPAQADGALNAALPWALAFALETHTYLTSRRVRAAWQDRDRHALAVNLGILAVLLAFSSWNQLGYLSGTWTPPHVGPLALPTWAAYGVRACIVPLAFMAAAFLAPLAAPITAQIENEARNVLADVFKIARQQRKRMLKDAQKSGRDLTGALVELVADPDTRRIIAHAYGAIRPDGSPAENITAEQAMQAVARDLKLADYPPSTGDNAPSTGDNPGDDDRPPTGPGSPTVASKLASMPAREPATGGGAAANVTPIRRGLGRAPRRDRKTASRANARSGKRGKAEEKVRAALASKPDANFDELVARTRLSESTVSKWLEVIRREATQPSQTGQTA